MHALYAEGDLSAGRRAFDEAYRAAEQGGDGGAMAQAALGLGGLWLPARRGAPESVLVRMRLRRALTRVAVRAPVALRVRTRLAAEADYDNGGHGAVLRHLAEARRRDDPVAYAEAAALARNCVSGPDHRPLRLELTRELTEAAGRGGRRCDPLLGMFWTTVGLFQDADPQAGQSLTELRRQLSVRDHASIGSAVRAIEVMCELRAGRLASAWSAAEAGVGHALSAGDPDAAHWHLLQMKAVRWYQGHPAEPRVSGPDRRIGRVAAALTAARDGDPAESGRDLAELPRTDAWLARLYTSVESAQLRGDAELSAAAYELLLPYARRPMIAGPAVACFGSTQHALGLAALAAGRVDSAVEHLREAVRDNRTLGHRPAAALSRWRLARALALRGLAGDGAQADEERAGAEREAAEMGMRLPADSARDVESVRVAVPARPQQPIRCRRVGRQWEITLDQRSVRVVDRRGVLYLAMLCASPGREIPAAELVAGPALLKAAENAARSVQTVLDDVARRDFHHRLAVLGQEIDRSGADAERAERAKAERDWLLAELASNTGLGGRNREFANAEERARIAVGKAIRRALAYIESADPVIGRWLRDRVHTGVRCCYLPS